MNPMLIYIRSFVTSHYLFIVALVHGGPGPNPHIATLGILFHSKSFLNDKIWLSFIYYNLFYYTIYVETDTLQGFEMKYLKKSSW